MAGNIKKAALNSPLNNRTRALCVPHPKHSMPRNFFDKQGSINSSMVAIFCITILGKKKGITKKNHNIILNLRIFDLSIDMKAFYILLFIAIIGYTFYEQSKPEPNVWIQAIGVLVFFFGMMKLMAKIPSNTKEEDKDGDI